MYDSQKLRDRKDETLINYDRVVRESLARSESAMERIVAFQERFNHVSKVPSKKEVLDHFLDLCEAKFGTENYPSYVCWLNPIELRLIFDRIESSDKVAIFFKDHAWELCNRYAFQSTVARLLNIYYPSAVRVNRKKSNEVYRRYKIDMGEAEEHKPRRPDKLQAYLKQRAIRREELESIFSAANFGGSAVGFDMKTYCEAAFSGDLRKLQRLIFPKIAQTILLHSELDKGEEDAGVSIPRALLIFDIIRLLAPELEFFSETDFEREFQSGSGFYDGNYSRYQRDKLHTILGL